MIAAWLSAFPDARCTISTVLAEGDLVAWVVHTTGTHAGEGLGVPPTGRRIDTLSANIGRIRGGQAIEHWSEQGMLATLQQIGVVPEMRPEQVAAG